MKIANKAARKFVQQRLPFQGNNLFAQVHTRNSEDGTSEPDTWYVVYSYGPHHPLFVWANGIWFENEDRFSVTTSRHRTLTHPHCPTVLLPFEWMQRLARGGYRELVKARIVEGLAA